MEELTPMMKAYLQTKENYKDTILFYRLGDFYEMFYDDAILVSKELELVLTGKNCGLSERAPMCGVPHHAAESYISRLVERGYKVAICEQVEDPKLAKGIVKREVVRVITPGTNIQLDTDNSVFIACIIMLDTEFGIALSDVACGEFMIRKSCDFPHIIELLQKTSPKEIIINSQALIHKSKIETAIGNNCGIFVINDIIDNNEDSKTLLLDHFKDYDSNIASLDYSLGIVSGANLLRYLYDTQKNSLSHINKIKFLDESDLLKIDAFTFKNLELLEPLRRGDNKGSLFNILDKTNTAMGKRLLKSFIRYPITDIDLINMRLDAIENLNEDRILTEEIKEILKEIYDLERLIGRVSFKTANPRDLLKLRDSIKDFKSIKTLLSDLRSDELLSICEELDPLIDIYKLIDESIKEDAPVGVHDADIIRPGFNEDCDRLRSAATGGKSLLSELEIKEKERTGISKLRIKYNKVFGYYFEVTNSQLDLVPDDFIRRQTLANCERFFTEELKALEDTILGANEKLNRLENQLFNDILDTVFSNIERIQKSASEIAKLDVYISLSICSVNNRYVRPVLNNNGIIDIKGGRHPVVEKLQAENFIENDTYLDGIDNKIYLITGPNMAGKSTYMRQCALIVLMAQIGSFVPASFANIGIVDRIFTRVGASDDLSSGQSTFMVEMNEMANILKNATNNSLIILDEIGRGTATYDGLSIAWAIIEHIALNLKAKTLFATHYHELTPLENDLPGVINYSSAVKEEGDNIIFLRKITKGAADKSYGIQVASLAGVPQTVTDRAKEILEEIISEKEEYSTFEKSIEKQSVQLTFFDGNSKNNEVIEKIKSFDINNVTPIDTLNFLNKLKKDYKL